MSHHYINDNINIGNVTSSYNNTWNNYNYRVVDEKSQILAWLSPLESWRQQNDIQARRVDEVGNRFLQTEEYRNWLGGIREGESDGSALFCYGGAGVGKTYMR